MLERAKELRCRPTEWEVRLWRHLSRSQLGDHKFRRQQVNRPYICDFLCPAKALVVEIDGHTHDPVEDARRDAYLLRRGFRTLRFTNTDVRENMDGVLQTITAELARSPDRWPDPVLTAPPQPLPQEGLRLRQPRCCCCFFQAKKELHPASPNPRCPTAG